MHCTSPMWKVCASNFNELWSRHTGIIPYILKPIVHAKHPWLQWCTCNHIHYPSLPPLLQSKIINNAHKKAMQCSVVIRKLIVPSTAFQTPCTKWAATYSIVFVCSWTFVSCPAFFMASQTAALHIHVCLNDGLPSSFSLFMTLFSRYH